MKIKKLNESMLPSQATLDNCLDDYRQNAFGFAGVEDYVDTNYPMHSQEFKAAVCDYLKNHKNESLQEAWQVGDQVTLKWNEPNFEPYAYATCEYQGKTEDGKHKFKSTTYGWDFIVDLENKKIKTPHDKEYDLWDESGWTKNAVEEDIETSTEDKWCIEYNDGATQRHSMPNNTKNVEGTWEDVLEELDSMYVDIPGEHDDGDDVICSLEQFIDKYEDNADLSGSTAVLKITKNGETVYQISDYERWGFEDDLDESKSAKESSNTMIYLFPELTDEDLDMLKAYGLQLLGINHGAYGNEENWVVRGQESSLRMFADKYLGYELHPDYLYDEDDFAGDIEPLKESITHSPLSTAGPIPYAVKLLYQMDRFVMDVYDNEGWLMNGVPDGEFEETTPDEAMQNYTEHMWLIEDDDNPGEINWEDFNDFIDTFSNVTESRDYDQEERNRIIDEADTFVREYAKYNNGEMLEELLVGLELDKDDILDWLAEHEQAWADAERHFGDSSIEEVSVKDLVEWIADHQQLYDDFHRFFYEDNLDEEFLNFDFNQNPDDDVDGIIQ